MLPNCTVVGGGTLLKALFRGTHSHVSKQRQDCQQYEFVKLLDLLCFYTRSPSYFWISGVFIDTQRNLLAH